MLQPCLERETVPLSSVSEEDQTAVALSSAEFSQEADADPTETQILQSEKSYGSDHAWGPLQEQLLWSIKVQLFLLYFDTVLLWLV